MALTLRISSVESPRISSTNVEAFWASCRDRSEAYHRWQSSNYVRKLGGASHTVVADARLHRLLHIDFAALHVQKARLA